LTTYDVASRIGAHLKLEPERVFLHAGAAEGARTLGTDPRRETLAPDELPTPFSRLLPREIEDCLCIFKEEIASLAQPAGYARMAKDEAREAEAREWSDALLSDAADEAR
ncbi:MAG TPA: hypothetical protein VFX98_08920, partial [Longimicrobiaceae bacterium]|nr:hypothetical protein [Longimicrobiaceae bacterium]